MRAISPQAYGALREALPLIFWHKRAFETYVRAAFSSHPELLVGLSFNEPKRETSTVIMERLMHDVSRYRDTTVSVMLDIASMERFPDIEKIREAADRKKWLREAEAAVTELRLHTGGHTTAVQQRAKRENAAAQELAKGAKIRKFSDDLSDIRTLFTEMHAMTDAQERGRRFERVLNRLFALYDLEPKLGYVLPAEQIDGAITFDTDDYILEAKWQKDPVGRDQLDAFVMKVQRKGKNALGIFVSQNGFSSAGLDTYRQAASFLAVTGEDLYLVLDGRVPLTELIRAKKRHANETGSCMLTAKDYLS